MKKYIFSITIGMVALVAIAADILLYSKINVLEKSIVAIPKAAPIVVQPAPTPQPNLSAPTTTASGGLTNSALDELKIKIEKHDAILESLGAPPALIREWSDFYNTKYGIQFAAPFGGHGHVQFRRAGRRAAHSPDIGLNSFTKLVSYPTSSRRPQVHEPQ